MPSEQKRRLSRRTVASAIVILVLMPLTIWFGMTFLKNRQYYFISLCMIIYTMIPFFLRFESRKPQARELIVISVLAAIAIAGRIAFFWLPQFKPVVAIVIIAGICFGGEAGFLVGAVAGFVSNFFFGQGPFTPWQMFCFGIIGFIAGVLFQKEILPKKKLVVCIYGGLATLLLYGGIINLSSIITSLGQVTLPAVLGIYISALPFDIIHAAATVIFLFFIFNPMMEKLERIKVKYGMLDTLQEDGTQLV